MGDNYTYPAVFDYTDEDYVGIQFPSFDFCVTDVEKGENEIEAAQELLALTIADLEDKKQELPSAGADIQLEEGQKLVYINVWMPYHRTKIKETYVKKTLTIPSWLDVLAKQNNVNFSAVLVEALKKKLGIE